MDPKDFENFMRKDQKRIAWFHGIFMQRVCCIIFYG